MGKWKSYLLGFTVGGIAAGVTVLLSTPKSGKEMRRDLYHKWEDINLSVIDIKNAAGSVKESVNDFAVKGIPLIKSTVSDIRSAVDAWRDDVQPNIDKITEDMKRLNEERKTISLNSSKAVPPTEE
ncbi:YtxH domain-containing protein [Camelliibacillus cellulosilyticus]|uniref:YtxH domain-containing protein n=1 Tax=Camelliibacillus cellulosilyticus TaxID=2174486 RepID=A0ABV9GLR6_9BACL